MKIYGDNNSGNCLKVKWVCDHLKLPYEWIEIDTLKGGSRTAEFLEHNPWGQVPTVAFDDGRTLAQSNAIIRYLARDSDLIPAEAFAAAQMDARLFWEQNSHGEGMPAGRALDASHPRQRAALLRAPRLAKSHVGMTIRF